MPPSWETNVRGGAAGMKASECMSATEGSRSLGWRKSTKLKEGKAERRGSSRRQTGGGLWWRGQGYHVKGVCVSLYIPDFNSGLRAKKGHTFTPKTGQSLKISFQKRIPHVLMEKTFKIRVSEDSGNTLRRKSGSSKDGVFGFFVLWG